MASRELCTRLLKLLVNFGRFNLGGQFATFYVRSDVSMPLLQVAAGAGPYRRIDKRLHIAGENEFLGAIGDFGTHDGARWHELEEAHQQVIWPGYRTAIERIRDDLSEPERAGWFELTLDGQRAGSELGSPKLTRW